jgi:hypothetical protein
VRLSSLNNRNKKWIKITRVSETCKYQVYQYMHNGNIKWEEREQWAERIFKEILANSFPNLI